MIFNRKIYFDGVRNSLFDGAMSQQQVDGQNAILTQWEEGDTGTPMTDLRWLAYCLATTFWECAQKMWPIEEIGKGKGHAYGKPDPETGNVFYGRGFVQLTHKENYDRATKKLALTGDLDLVWHPEKALDLLIASRIMFRGMSEGWFTAKKLGQYFSATKNDPVNARAIINNDVSKMGKRIAGFHEIFFAALEAATVEELPAAERQQVLVALSVPFGIEVIVTINGEPITAY